MRAGMSIVHILHQKFIDLAIFVERSYSGVQFEVVRVQLIDATDVALVEQFGKDLDVFQRLKHLEFSFHFLLCVQDEVLHALESKIMRDF
jgi:hypothetical protein